MDLGEIRKQIDELDRQLLDLMEQRMELVSKVSAYKKEQGLAVLDKGREVQVLAQAASSVKNTAYQEALLENMRTILETSKDFQRRELEGKNG